METLISKNRCDPGYEITAKNNSVITVKFFPIDLSRKNGNGLEIFSTLENVFYARQERFLEDMRFMAQLAESADLCNCVQSCRISFAGNIAFGESTFYNGNPISDRLSIEDVLLNISGICSAMSKITKHAGTVDVRLEDIICEPENAGAVHFLYIGKFGKGDTLARDLAKLLLSKIKCGGTKPGDLVIFEKFVQKYNAHPQALRNIIKLLKILTCKKTNTDWNSAAQLALQIKSIIDISNAYFLRPANTLPRKFCGCAEAIDNALKQADAAVLYSNGKAALNVARAYIACRRETYLHTAYCNASNGIRNAVLSEDLALSSGETAFSDRISAIKKICAESALIIVDGFSDEDGDFHVLAEIPAKLLIISNEDLSDYGFISIKIPEENYE